jgi:hypothetical protein
VAAGRSPGRSAPAAPYSRRRDLDRRTLAGMPRSNPVHTRNRSRRSSTHFECGAFNPYLQMPGRTRVKSRGRAGRRLQCRAPSDRSTWTSKASNRSNNSVLAAVGGSWPPSRRAFYPRSPKTSPAPELCKAVYVSRQIASHWRRLIVTKARPPRPPGARTRTTRVRGGLEPPTRPL